MHAHAGIDPPRKREFCYQTTALPPSTTAGSRKLFNLPANFSVGDGSISCGEIPVIDNVCLPQPFFSLGQGDVLAVGMGVTQAGVEHEQLTYGLQK